MKKILIITSVVLLGLVGCKPNNSTSSSSSQIESSQPTSIIVKTPKEEILDICDVIINNSEEKNIISSTQTFNGNLTITNLDSTSSIYYSNKINLSNFVINSSSEYIKDDETTKSLYDIVGNIVIDHKEEYLGTEEGIETNNFTNTYTLDELIMLINDNMYVDLSSEANSLFDEEQLTISPDLKFKQENFNVILDELMEEYFPDFEINDADIPEIDPNEILEEFIGEDSLFNEYLKYVKEDNVLKLKLTLKPADFNELLNDLYLEYDPESTVPISTIIQMETTNSSKFEIVFNFTSDDIESMDVNIDGRFNILADTYSMNVKVQGSVVNNEINEFVPLENYENFVSCEDAKIDVKQQLKDVLDSIIPMIEEENTSKE